MLLTKSEILSYLEPPKPLVDHLIDPDVQVQPNGVDLSVLSISKFGGPGTIDFSNRERELPDTTPINFDSAGWVNLSPGCYLVDLNETINLPLDVMALTWSRSSLLRMGVSVSTAIWDAGYCGGGQSLLTVSNQYGVKISRNARIIQLVFVRLPEETEGYDGIYQKNVGI